MENFPCDQIEQISMYLFAEDLINHFMDKLHWQHTRYSNVKVAPVSGLFRGCTHNGFTENVRKAADIIHNLCKDEIDRRFSKFRASKITAQRFFSENQESLRDNCFRDGQDAIMFLKYCVSLTVLGYHLYKRQYFKIPDMATKFIVEAFPSEMFPVTWEILEKAATSFVARHAAKYLRWGWDDLNPDANSDLYTKVDQILSSGYETCSCFNFNEDQSNFETLFRNREVSIKRHENICLQGANDKDPDKNSHVSRPSKQLKILCEVQKNEASPEAHKKLTLGPKIDLHVELEEPSTPPGNVSPIERCSTPTLLNFRTLEELFGSEVQTQDLDNTLVEDDADKIIFRKNTSIARVKSHRKTRSHNFGNEEMVACSESKIKITSRNLTPTADVTTLEKIRATVKDFFILPNILAMGGDLDTTIDINGNSIDMDNLNLQLPNIDYESINNRKV